MKNIWHRLTGGRRPKDDGALDVIRKVPVFKGLGGAELVEVERIMHWREFNTGEVIMRQGSAGHGMYIIVHGEVSITHEGSDHVLAELGAGDFLGELSILFKQPRSATATAKTPTRTLSFFQTDLYKLIEGDPKLGAKIVHQLSSIVAERLKNCNEQVAALRSEMAAIKGE